MRIGGGLEVIADNDFSGSVENVEQSFAHMYETGAMRRTHLRHYDNIIKRVLIHASAFNLVLAMQKMTGYETPRGLQSRINLVVYALRPLRAGTQISRVA